MFKFFDKRFFIIFIFPIILGGLTVLSFQPFNFFFINFFSLSSLFFLIIYVKKRSKSIYRKKPFYRNLFILGTSYGFGFYFFGIYWIVYSLTFDPAFQILIPFALILIPLILSLTFSLPVLFVGSFIKNDIASVFLISLFFSLADFLKGAVFPEFPWNLWVYSFSWSLETLQILSLIGLFSLNILVLTLFFSPTILFIKKKSKYYFLGIIILGFFSNYLYGSYKINTFKPNINEKVNFKIVSAQFNLSDFANQQKIINKLVKLSEPNKGKKTVFVWPEGTFVKDIFYSSEDIKTLFKNNFSKNHLIIFGGNTKNNDTFFNSMQVADNEFKIIYKYDKKKLVPFGEFLPFEKYLTIFGLKKITPGYSSFSSGKGDSVAILNFGTTNFSLLTLICYEIIFPNLVEKNLNRFNFILNISEDAWFGESIGPFQHFAKSIFRSIESRRYTIRAANKGISAFVDPTGKILKNLEPNEEGNIEMELPILNNNDYTVKKSLKFPLLLITYIFLIFILLRLKF